MGKVSIYTDYRWMVGVLVALLNVQASLVLTLRIGKIEIGDRALA
jgi:hypothetical protein